MAHKGLPICSACERSTVLKALEIGGPNRRPFILSCDDPTATFEESIGEGCPSWLERDLVTLTARRLIEDDSCISCDKSCIFCTNSEIVESILSSASWRRLTKRYFRLAAKCLRVVYRESEEQDESTGHCRARYITQRFECGPFVCQRCGVLSCEDDEECPWYFGEDNVNESIAETFADEWTRKTLANMKPACRCSRSSSIVKKKQHECICGTCKNCFGDHAPCKKCSKCCADVKCNYHFRRPLPPRVRIRFWKHCKKSKK